MIVDGGARAPSLLWVRVAIGDGGRLGVEDELENLQLQLAHSLLVRNASQLGADVARERVHVVAPAPEKRARCIYTGR